MDPVTDDDGESRYGWQRDDVRLVERGPVPEVIDETEPEPSPPAE